MITTQLLRPESIVVVGASNNVHKPGGAILKNLINGGYQGELRAVNPKEKKKNKIFIIILTNIIINDIIHIKEK